MRIGVLRTQVPFVTGGAERHAANLVAALNRRGFDATEITLPFKWYPGEVLADHIMAAKMLDVSEVEGVKIDLTIGLKFPAYLANHPNRLFWVLHQHRQAYDQWDLGSSDLLDDPRGEALRALIHAEDRAAFEASQNPIYANSGNVAGRLEKHLGLASTPLYHPPPNAENLRQGAYGDYLFVPGRINPSKRLELTLEALARSEARLVIAGVAENPLYQNRLMHIAQEMGIAGRITWLGAVDDATLIKHYAEARGVVFVPQDEDYGYITLEAMLSGKPVITVTDAGGPLEFITDGVEGLIAEPEATALGRSFDQLMQDASGAERMGQAGLARYQAQNISWDHVVETLTGQRGIAVEPVIAPPAIAEPVVEAQTALDTLRRAIAPPEAPADLPFANITEVLQAYAFDELPAALGRPEPPIDAGLAGYLGTHWTRFMSTLRQLEGLEITSALDVGVFPPLVFQALLANQFDGIDMHGLWEGPDPYRQSVKARRDAYPSFDITLKVANGERDPWPYPDNSFDLVTGMEILEHLALDPYFFYTEAARVLKPGGHILITTPNVVSHRGLWKSLNNIAPYSFGIFVPSGGVYGRHNREYAPQELARIGEAAGFETLRLDTFDVYDRHIEPEVAQILVARGDDLSMRGENIQYLARKAGAPKGVPENLYHGDPTRMHGALTVESREESTGLTRLTVTNTSPSYWPTSGDRATCILAEWTNTAGELRHQHLMQPLNGPLAPNESGQITLRLDAGTDAATGSLRLHLYQSGVGVFSGRGRAAPLELPCSEAAFLRMVDTTPLPRGTP
ncbi:glycosyltransferase [Sulfitobacter sp. F26204]|uniref:glycosyltransferase n=1 Tax=Sulfitobacter sp. F26204 TaxID=2996014 RepID=UPI00225DFC83|nr:glycosyltransferase [Sulfitobacter sp. F26204]MCX7561841.1 glycosyltransferase [Sulfitobacter sp. F26204]